ncbi:hypothetical protein JHK82_048978 [Glycine max]|uniref:Uncharacterized protein n=2 Tax=Glycine subgen. Soja TaxID=1462606 RepID=A0A0R0ETV8_SOYBN|nr:hypothetical protein JHK86_048831 [Glycine max]KAG5090200.1 hypothetical protein JHK82_048978 [Glycine max]KAG5093275.1 hypothetical protein JHK84_048863 [Glycine max]KAH1152547.1 hypothetical protein GYH30_048594 [Glycine max]RZB50004.1 hypothetical protein D0Y65_047116 [Glycine soja]
MPDAWTQAKTKSSQTLFCFFFNKISSCCYHFTFMVPSISCHMLLHFDSGHVITPCFTTGRISPFCQSCNSPNLQVKL